MHKKDCFNQLRGKMQKKNFVLKQKILTKFDQVLTLGSAIQ